MLDGYSPVTQTLLGTLFTWGMTAFGAGLVFIFQSGQRKILDGSLGFAAGVMTAASFWSLLEPALEYAEQSGLYGEKGQWAFVPVVIGFVLGAVFVYGADVFMPQMNNPMSLALSVESDYKTEDDGEIHIQLGDDDIPGVKVKSNSEARQRRKPTMENFLPSNGLNSALPEKLLEPVAKAASWRRILLLIIAITVHNIPEGLAVGVGFGAVGKTKTATFENARNLAFGIGIQNFPEGLAVSLPLRGAGLSTWKCFWYGQLSGMVEPLAGLFGAAAVVIAEPLLPYALSFAAGAMIYVVVDDIIPEAQLGGNGKLASWGAIFGFAVMMSLDVGLG